ncbi:hypothetical protein [Bacteroides timonensis]|uniref:hypothetical protein n=1 Tax=Bacteroides timonensis TaxID=1470345 RepID=UPI0004BBF55D|nr:hypothetical protein [Bacteroides timonensis]
MRTLIIYNGIEEHLKYVIIEGDYSRLHGAMINVFSRDKEIKAIDLLFDNQTGDFLLELSEDITLVESKCWDKIAVITFVP